MLKKTILTILLGLTFTMTAGATDAKVVKIEALDDSGISYSDIAEVSRSWAQGDHASYNYIVGQFHPAAVENILNVSPALAQNKRVLLSLSLGLVIYSQQPDADVQEAMRNLATHPDLVKKPTLSVEEVLIALTSVSA